MKMTVETFAGVGWLPIGVTVSPDGPPGSLSSQEPAGRQVYVFGWHDGRCGVWRSVGGADVATLHQRVIATAGLEQIADLAFGDHYELDWWKDGTAHRIRFRVWQDGESGG